MEKIAIRMAKTGVYTVIHTPVFAILMAIFPGGPVLLASTRMCLLWILFHRMMMEMVVTAGAIRCKVSNDHHQQANT